MTALQRIAFSSVVLFSVFANAGVCEIELIRSVDNQEVLGRAYCVDIEDPKSTHQKVLSAAILACKNDSACIRVQDGASGKIYFKKKKK